MAIINMFFTIVLAGMACAAVMVLCFCAINSITKMIDRAEAKDKPSKGGARALKSLEGYEFDPMVIRVFEQHNPHLSPSQRDLAFAGLKSYFELLLIHQQSGGRGVLGMPSKLADDAWHAFILCTQQYASFCALYFGKFIHHHPDPILQSHSLHAQNNFKEDVLRTWHLAKQNKHNLVPAKPANSPDGNPALGSLLAGAALAAVPLLFAMDSHAGIPNGWTWDSASLQNLDLQSEQFMQVERERQQGQGAGSGDGGVIASGDAGMPGDSSSCASSGSSSDSSCGSSCGGGGGCGGS